MIKVFLVKKFNGLGTISISSNVTKKNTLFDFTINITHNNPLHYYIVYLYTINILLKFKKILP